ncbi:MAG: uracil-DNA glycosylase [Spirochaetia bacterium]|nr:uracil-DNA glycosylase [Spirochaetia bacterium]MBQ6673413.1 uracil-DNA glycosylase [Spirochaetia bacterium]
MENFDSELWKLINNTEDYIKYGSISDRKLTDMVLKKEEPDTLETIAAQIAGCRKCRLCEKRRNVVPGMGVLNPDVLVVGEGPGGDEDMQGQPFVGRAGQYLDKWLDAIGLSRHTNCYIGNVVKCRPPMNRDPQPDEIDSCLPYLERQIAILKPKFILTVGRISSAVLAGQEAGIGRLRGRTYSYKGIPLIPTYHPSAVLRDPTLRKPVWDDLRRLKAELEEIKNGR